MKEKGPSPSEQRKRLEYLRNLEAEKTRAATAGDSSSTVNNATETPNAPTTPEPTPAEIEQFTDFETGQTFKIGDLVYFFRDNEEHQGTIESFATEKDSGKPLIICSYFQDGRKKTVEHYPHTLDIRLEEITETKDKKGNTIRPGDTIFLSWKKFTEGDTMDMDVYTVETIKENPINKAIYLYARNNKTRSLSKFKKRDVLKCEEKPAPTPGYPISSESVFINTPAQPESKKVDTRLIQALEIIFRIGRANSSDVEKVGYTYPEIIKLFEELETKGIIAKAGDERARAVIITPEQQRVVVEKLGRGEPLEKMEEEQPQIPAFLRRERLMRPPEDPAPLTPESAPQKTMRNSREEVFTVGEEVWYKDKKYKIKYIDNVSGEIILTALEDDALLMEASAKIDDISKFKLISRIKLWSNLQISVKHPNLQIGDKVEIIDIQGDIYGYQNLTSRQTGRFTHKELGEKLDSGEIKIVEENSPSTTPAVPPTPDHAQEQGADKVLAELLDPNKKLYFDGKKVKEILGDQPTKEKNRFNDQNGERGYNNDGTLYSWKINGLLFEYSWGKLYRKKLPDGTYERYTDYYNGLSTTDHYTANHDLTMTTDTQTGEVIKKFDVDSDPELKERLSRTIKVNGKDKKLSEVLNEYGNGTVNLGGNETKTYKQGKLKKWNKENGDEVSYDEKEGIQEIFYRDGRYERYTEEYITHYETDGSKFIVDRVTGKVVQKFDKDGKEIPLTAEDKGETINTKTQGDQAEENEGKAEMGEEEVETSLDSLYIKSLKNAFKQDKTSIKKIMHYAEITINEETAQKILNRMINEGMVERKADKDGVHKVIPSKLRQRKILEGLETGVVISTEVNKEKEEREIRLKNNKKELEETENKLKILELQEEIDKMETDLININRFRLLKKRSLRKKLAEARKELTRREQAL